MVSRTVLLSLRLLIFIGRGVMVEMVEEFSFNVRTMFKLLPNFYLKTHRYRKNRARTSANCCLRHVYVLSSHPFIASRRQWLPHPDKRDYQQILKPSCFLSFSLYISICTRRENAIYIRLNLATVVPHRGGRTTGDTFP